jgi:hypothetical protein
MLTCEIRKSSVQRLGLKPKGLALGAKDFALKGLTCPKAYLGSYIFRLNQGVKGK